MKRSMLFVFALLFSPLVYLVFDGEIIAQQKLTPAQQLQQAKTEIAKRDIIIADLKAERNSFILQLATQNAKIESQNRGIDKATNLLQKGYDSGKLNYKEIWDTGFRIDIDSSNAYQRPKDKKDKGK